MILVLDTSILIDIQKTSKKTISALNQIVKEYPYPPKITIFNSFEFHEGLLDKAPKNMSEAKEFLLNFGVLHTTNKTPEILANLKHKYRKKGQLLPIMDLLIAGIVIENNLTLVTKDKDFEKITELKKIIL